MAQFASDAFTGTDGTELSVHDAAWSLAFSTNSNTAALIGNRVRRVSTGSTSSIARYVHSGSPASADYSVSLTYRVVTATNEFTGVTGRSSEVAETFYMARYINSSALWQLYKFVTGTATLLGSFSQTLTVDTDYVLTLRMIGTTISLEVDGVERVSVTDSDISDAGKAGIRFAGAVNASDTTGYHFDNFSADDIGAAASLLPLRMGNLRANMQNLRGRMQ